MEVDQRLGEAVQHVQPFDEVEVAGDDRIAVAGAGQGLLDAGEIERVPGSGGRYESALPSPARDAGRPGPCSCVSVTAQPHPQSSSPAWSKNQPFLARSISQQSHTSCGMSSITACQNGSLGGVSNSTARLRFHDVPSSGSLFYD